MPNYLPPTMPSVDANPSWFSRRRLLTTAAIVPASVAVTAAQERFGALRAGATDLALAKASSLVEAFTTLPSSAYWGTDVTNPPYVNGDGLLHMPAGANYYSRDLFDWTSDTVSLEYFGGDHLEFSLFGSDFKGIYGFTYINGQVWCNRITRSGGSDDGFVAYPFDASKHRFCFLVQSGGQVLWQTAGSYWGARTTLRTAPVSDLGITNLRLGVANRAGSGEATVDNLNCDAGAAVVSGTGPLTATVDFNSPVAIVAPDHVGYTVTAIGPTIDLDATQETAERALDARRVRIIVKWDGSHAVTAGGGSWPRPCKAIVDKYRSWGYTVVVCIAGRTSDVGGYQSGDATHIVNELGTNGIEYTGVNEILQFNGTMDDLVSLNTQIWHDVQAAAPGTRLWGPTLDRFDRTMMFDQYLLKVPSGMDAGADYHWYGMWNPALSTSQAMAGTTDARTQVARSMADMRDNGLPMRVMISEFNFTSLQVDGLSTDQGGVVDPSSGQVIDGRLFTPVQTTWMSSVIGNVLRSGGMCLAYGSHAQALSIFVDNRAAGDTAIVPGLGGRRPASSPTPAYWAIAMFTGAGTPGGSRNFPHFKDRLYSADTAAPLGMVEVFALNNEAGGYNVVIVNKETSGSRNVTLNLANLPGGHYDAWQTSNAGSYAAFSAPSQISAWQSYDRQMTLQVPSCTVTTVVLHPGS